MKRRGFRMGLTAVACAAAIPAFPARADEALRAKAKEVMAKAVTFYRAEAASHGGYVYYYAEDLGRRWGEGEATREQIWVQPPGTPTVGMALLAAHEATGAAGCLEAAVEAAEALVYGQLKSGGWTNAVDFDPAGERRGNYRIGKGGGKGKNFSTLDDGITQAALRFLMRADRAIEGKNAAIREAVEIGIDALLSAQFPNGGFPQGWEGPVPAKPAQGRARYPDYDWRTEGRIKEYWNLYTLNDGVAGEVAKTLAEAHAIYGQKQERFRDALARLGDFLVLAQMPEPQPGWAQQYNDEMIPVWARKFEPPAIAGRESQDVMDTLMSIATLTREARYLAPVPKALAYLKKSLLSSGELARYYELRSNKPLYMSRRGDVYSLTYDDSDLPDHYGWKGDSRLEAIERRYRTIMQTGKDEGGEAAAARAGLESRVREIVGSLDAKGRWVSSYGGEGLVGQPKFKPGERYISSAVFSENMESLAAYVAGTAPR